MSERRKIIAKLRNKYRLVLINESSFGEVLSIRLTPLNVLMLLSSAFILFTIIIYLLIAYTPMRQMMPGYGRLGENNAWMEVNQRVEDLGREVSDKQLKIDALNTILSEQEKKFDSTSESLKGKLK
jgi:hypothetical protein